MIYYIQSSGLSDYKGSLTLRIKVVVSSMDKAISDAVMAITLTRNEYLDIDIVS